MDTTTALTTEIVENVNLIDQAVEWSGLTEQFVAVAFGAIGLGLIVLAGVFVARMLKKNRRGYRR